MSLTRNGNRQLVSSRIKRPEEELFQLPDEHTRRKSGRGLLPLSNSSQIFTSFIIIINFSFSLHRSNEMKTYLLKSESFVIS